eukprot:538369_1
MSEPAECALCGREFESIQGLRRHYIACKNKHSSPCSVCFEDKGTLTKCVSCKVTIHPNCVGLRSLDPPFKCEPCKQSQNPSNLRCELCPNYGGILVQLESNHSKWVHISCCLWLPNVILSRHSNKATNTYKIYANISNLGPIKHSKATCIHCNIPKGKQVFCLVCGAHCHVTCSLKCNFLLNMVPLQEYATWNTQKVSTWLRGINLPKAAQGFERNGIDGLALGELKDKDMKKILDLGADEIRKLKQAIQTLQEVKLGLQQDEYQTLRGVWSVCSKHRHVQYSAPTFIKLWKKHFESQTRVIKEAKQTEMKLSKTLKKNEEQQRALMNEEEVKCMGCGSMSDEEHFLLCDNDEIEKHGAHMYCLDPALSTVPSTDWFCPGCCNTKYIDKRCLYCASSMYGLRKDVIQCNAKKRKCDNVCHMECARKVNDLMDSNRKNWRCPLCCEVPKPVLHLQRRNNELVVAKSPNHKQRNRHRKRKFSKLNRNGNENGNGTRQSMEAIAWHLFEVAQPNEVCSIGARCKKVKEGKKHYHCRDMTCMHRSGGRWYTDRLSGCRTHQVMHKTTSNTTIKRRRLKLRKFSSSGGEEEEEECEEESRELQGNNELIPKYSLNAMVDGIVTNFLKQIGRDSSLTMRSRSAAICKCLLQRTPEISRAVITIWIKQHKGDEKIHGWLQKAMVKLTNPSIDVRTKKDGEKLICDIFSVMTKCKMFKIGWKPRSKLMDVIASIMNNSRLDALIINLARNVKSLFGDQLGIPRTHHSVSPRKLQLKSSNHRITTVNKSGKNVFDPSFEDDDDGDDADNTYNQKIAIKLSEYPKLDWHEIVYGRYGSIKSEHEEKYGITVHIEDAKQQVLKPGFDAGKMDKIYVAIKGSNMLNINDAITSYKQIMNKKKKRHSMRDRHRSSHHNSRSRSYREKSRHHHHHHSSSSSNNKRQNDPRKTNGKKESAAESSETTTTETDTKKKVCWSRVQSTNSSGEIEYYFWNKVTNQTTWNEPKHWKDYEEDKEEEDGGGNILDSLHSVISSADQHLQRINDDEMTALTNNEEATKELLKLTSEFKQSNQSLLLSDQLNAATNYLNNLKKEKQKKKKKTTPNNKQTKHELNLYDSLIPPISKTKSSSSNRKNSKRDRSSSKSSYSDSSHHYVVHKRRKTSNNERERDRSRERGGREREREERTHRSQRDRVRERERHHPYERDRSGMHMGHAFGGGGGGGGYVGGPYAGNSSRNRLNHTHDHAYDKHHRSSRNHRKYNRR